MLAHWSRFTALLASLGRALGASVALAIAIGLRGGGGGDWPFLR
jgi:hypothetical protein